MREDRRDFRQLGIADELEATGVGPDRTEVITRAESIAGKQIARISKFGSAPHQARPRASATSTS